MPKKPNLAEAFKVDKNELQPKPELEIIEPKPVEQKATKPKKNTSAATLATKSTHN